MSTVKTSQPTIAARRSNSTAPAPAARTVAMCATVVTGAAVPLLRHFASSTARRWGLPAEPTDTMSLVVTELATNVVLHSGSREVSVLLTFDGAAVFIEVKDAGQWQARRGPRLVAEDANAAYGRGLQLVKGCTSWFLAFLSAAGTRVVACVPVIEGACRELPVG